MTPSIPSVPTSELPPESPAALAPLTGWRLLGWALTFYLLQVVAGEAGLAMRVDGLPALWPAAGVALAAWWRLGAVAAPVVWLAAYTLVLRLGLPPWPAGLLGAAATAGVGVAVGMLRWRGLAAVPDSQREVGWLLLACAAGVTVACAAGWVVWPGQLVIRPDAWAWWAMWLAAWIGAVITMPLFVVLLRMSGAPPPAGWPWLVTPALLVLATAVLAFTPWSLAPPGLRLLAYLPLPFVVLAAMRGGLAGAPLGATLLAVCAAAGSAGGFGPFVSGQGRLDAEGLQTLWVYLVVVGVGALVIGALQAQRRHAERRLHASRDLLDAIRQAQAAFISRQDEHQTLHALLQALITLTGSRFGFIGEVCDDPEGRPYLKALAMTDLGWSEQQRREVQSRLPQNFHRMDTLLGDAIVTRSPVIANDAAEEPRASGLPPGYPPLENFMGLPFFAGGQLVGMIGVANRPGGFDRALGERLAPFLDTCATLIEVVRSRSARRQADQQLRDSEARYRHLFEQSPNMMFVLDRQTLALLDVNEAMLAHYGYTREAFLGLALPDLFPRQDVPALLTRLSAHDHEETVRDSARHCLKSGEVIEVEWAAHAIRDRDRPARLVVVRDVTQQRQAERALLASEASHREMFLHNPHPMWVYDPRTLRFLDVNDAAVAMYGYARADFLSMTLDQLCTASQGDEPESMVDEGLRALRVREHTRHRTRDGRVLEVEGSVHAITYRGRPARLALWMDVTDRVAAERALRESEARLDVAVHGVGDGVWDWDVAADGMACSPNCERMLGYEPGTIAPTQAAWDALTHTADLPAVRAAIDAIVAGPGDVLDLEFRLRGRDGSWRWVRERGKVLERGPDGRARRVVGTQIDTTAQRQAEATRMALLEQLREVANHVPGAIFELRQAPDAGVRFSYISDRVRDLLDLTPGDVQARFSAALARVLAPDRPALLASIRACADGLSMWRAEFRVRRRGGAERWLRASASPQRQPDGTVLWHGYVQDVTDYFAREAAEQERTAAESANRAKTVFLSRMSHELRTPLNAVLGFAQLLELDRQEPLGPEQRRRVGHIREAGQHLLDMIVELLDLTRIESGQMQFRIDAVPMRPLLEEVLALFEPEAGRAAVQLKLIVEDSAPRLLGTDGTRVRQILTNLVSNAVKYNRPQGSVEVRVAGQASAQGQAGVTITVADSGLGMSREQLARLFEPFNRLGRERTEVTGTGIGLALSKALIELLGGHVEVRSEVQHGSVFSVWLPDLWPDTAPGQETLDAVLP